MQDTFLGVLLSILAAILGSLSIFLLATGLCKAFQLLRSSPLPDVIPTRGNQTCACSLRAVARDKPTIVQCVVKFDDPPTALVERVPALPKLELEEQRSLATPNSVSLVSNPQPSSNLTDEKKIEILNKELPYAGGFH